MPRVQTPFGRQRELLDSALDKLRKYAYDPEWKTTPGYELRVSSSIEGARAAFGNLLEMVLPKKQPEEKPTLKKAE